MKVHAHGAQDDNAAMLFDGGLDNIYFCLTGEYNDEKQYRLQFVSSWEMYNIIRAAEAGEKGDPSEYKEYTVKK